MGSAVWLVTLGVGLLALAVFLGDRALLRMERRGWIYWRKRKGLSSMGVDFMQQVLPGAQHGKRALAQERARKNVRPAEEPSFHVDLEVGVVRIRPTGGGRRES
ncbi:hypothetical protein JCM4914_05420 [Streptomyces platensis subsp. malvinus]